MIPAGQINSLKLPSKERFFWPALTCALIAILLLLGNLQYRWSNEVSEATKARMKASLESSMLAFRQDFSRDLSELTLALEPALGPGPVPELATLARQTSRMRATATHSGLVKAVYVAQQMPSGQLRLLKENGTKGAFEPLEWPQELAALRTALPQPFGPKIFAQGPPLREHNHERGHKMQLGFGPRVLIQRHVHPWFVASAVPALVHPIEVHFGSDHREPDRLRHWIIVELDRTFL
ncbi:MAG TPA: hypothetical protein VG498_22940, partial [Terriglobales bacterium]|nr:hypothetical protein [Terriglobales bacterium]